MKKKKTNPDFFFFKEIKKEEILKKWSAEDFQDKIKNFSKPIIGDVKNKTLAEITDLTLHL